MKRAVVVGGGTWGTSFSRLLVDRGFDVTLAVRDAEVARTITETGRNPHYSSSVDLNGIAATTIADAPVDKTDLVVVAVPSSSFGSVVAGLTGSAPVLSLTKGLDPATGERLSTTPRKARLGTATTTRSALATGASAIVAAAIPFRSTLLE